MVDPRLRRLRQDYDQVRDEFDGHPAITVEPFGDPPEKYSITYLVRGTTGLPGGRPSYSSRHTIEIELTSSYPKEHPRCVPKTPIFHPNIGHGYVCIGDVWTPAETLADLIVRIGEMIQYKSYNPRSALNVEAAQWATTHGSLLPVDNTVLRKGVERIDVVLHEHENVDLVLHDQVDDVEIGLEPL